MKIHMRRSLATGAAALLVTVGLFTAITPASAATPVPANAQLLAQQLVNSGRVSGETEAWAQLTAYAGGSMRSHVINGQTRNCQINPVILNALKVVVVDRGFSVKISSLNRYCINVQTASGVSSYHWRNGGGHAVDVSVVNGVVSNGNTAQDRAYISAMFSALPAPAGLGQLNCHGSLPVPSGWVQFDDSCNHNHIEYRGSATVAPSTQASFDFNSDGRADVLGVAQANGVMTAYNGNGAGGLSSDTLGSGWGTTSALAHGDYNNDGRGDVIAQRSDGSLYFYRGNGANGFAGSEVGHGWGTMSLLTGGVDFNADGNDDLVARTAAGALNLYKGKGDGTFFAAVQIGHGWSSMTSLVAGDFTKDGRGDIAAVNSAGTLFIYPGNGTGLDSALQVGFGWGIITAVSGGGDYNSDGYADLLRRDSAGDLWVYPGKGSSGFWGREQIGHGWNGHRLIN